MHIRGVSRYTPPLKVIIIDGSKPYWALSPFLAWMMPQWTGISGSMASPGRVLILQTKSVTKKQMRVKNTGSGPDLNQDLPDKKPITITTDMESHICLILFFYSSLHQNVYLRVLNENMLILNQTVFVLIHSSLYWTREAWYC